jgi:glucosylglycerate synthase
MAGELRTEDLLGPDDSKVIDALEGVEVLIGVCALNQARSVVRVVEAATAGLSKELGDREGAVLVLDAGYREDTREAIGAWAADRPDKPKVRCVRISGPPSRPRAILAALAGARGLRVTACALVDAGLISLSPEAVGRLLQPILAGTADAVGPAYTHTVAEGTLTTNLLAPMLRALYGRRLQQLLGGCAALAQPTVARLLESDTLESDLTDHGLEIRLVIEAVALGDRLVEVHVGRKALDVGLAPPDLATTLAQTVGPFFRLMDRYRAVWAETAGSAAVPLIGDPPALLPEAGDVAVDRMVRAFKLGLKDLLPIWEQALPEETLSLLYPLGLLSPDEFAFPAEHWARVAFDFAVAYHEQRLPRDHLLRALTPLYLGRVASFLRETQAAPGARIPALLEAVGRAFEVEKAGLAARWR